MKKLITPLLVVAAMLGGFLSARELDAQVTYSPSRGETIKGTADPSAGGGVAAAEGTLYVRTGSTDQLWQKTGSGDTAWTNIAGGAASFSSLTVSGNITTTTGNIVATTGAITADGNITTSAGNLVATIGDVSVGDDVLATDDAVITDAITATNGRITGAGFTSSIAGTGSLPSYNWNVGGDTDNGMYYSGAANRWELAAGAADVWSVRTALALAYVPFQAASTAQFNSYIQMLETTAPGAPSADRVNIYAVVDGGGKTDLDAIFQSGAAQVFTQEP